MQPNSLIIIVESLPASKPFSSNIAL